MGQAAHAEGCGHWWVLEADGCKKEHAPKLSNPCRQSDLVYQNGLSWASGTAQARVFAHAQKHACASLNTNACKPASAFAFTKAARISYICAHLPTRALDFAVCWRHGMCRSFACSMHMLRYPKSKCTEESRPCVEPNPVHALASGSNITDTLVLVQRQPTPFSHLGMCLCSPCVCSAPLDGRALGLCKGGCGNRIAGAMCTCHAAVQ